MVRGRGNAAPRFLGESARPLPRHDRAVTNIPRREFGLSLLTGALATGSAAAAPQVKITAVETIALTDPGKYSMTLFRVRADGGIDGIGQAESPSLVIDAAIRTRGGLEDLLKNENPLDVERLKMYDRTGLWGRRGVTIAAIGAVETALWDIAGKLLERPVSELIWRSLATVKTPAAVAPRVRLCATVHPPGSNGGEVRARRETALSRDSAPSSSKRRRATSHTERSATTSGWRSSRGASTAWMRTAAWPTPLRSPSPPATGASLRVSSSPT
jgi:hypothetical protein